MFQGQAAAEKGEHPWVGHGKCFKAKFVSDYAADALGDKGILEEGRDLATNPLKKDALMRKVRDMLDRE